MEIYQPHKIVSVTLTDGGLQIEVIRKYPSNISYGDGKPAPDRVIKEIYMSAPGEGHIELYETIQGTHTPSSIVPEKIEFPE